MMKIVVGTRGSNLALRQTNMVIDMIKEKHPGVEFEVKIIKTKGDIIKDVPIDKIGGKEIFVKEIERELLEGTIDMAVHSMKDMPGKLPEGLKLSPPPIREDYRDVFLFREGIKSIEELPKGAKIGTGSKRRKYQILKYRPDLNIVPIRGNVETRIRKIEEENLDGVILAIEIRDKDEKVESILKGIYHRETEIQATVERGFLTAVGGSCKVPVGCYCEVLEDKIIVEGLLGSEEGDILIRKSIVEDINEYKEAGEKLGQILMREMTSK